MSYSSTKASATGVLAEYQHIWSLEDPRRYSAERSPSSHCHSLVFCRCSVGHQTETLMPRSIIE